MRVFELCDIANQADVIELAMKYASKISNVLLVDRLTDLQSEQKMRLESADYVSETNEL